MEYKIPITYICIFWAGLFLWIHSPKTEPYVFVAYCKPAFLKYSKY